MLFNFYRTLDIALILYFTFLFGPVNPVLPMNIALPVGWLIAALMTYRLVRSFLPSVPNNDSVLFDLVDCSHHHYSLDEKKERINRQG